MNEHGKAAKTATVAIPWTVTPDNTSQYSIGACAVYKPVSAAFESDTIYLNVDGVLHNLLGKYVAQIEDAKKQINALRGACREFGIVIAEGARVSCAEADPCSDVTPPVFGGNTGVTLTPDGQDGVAHRVRLERTPLGVALRDARIVQGEGGAWALPLRNRDAWSALIELGPPALQAAPGAFETLFDAVVQRVVPIVLDTPGVAEGCWTWRFDWSQVDHLPAERLLAMTQAHGRKLPERAREHP